MSQQSSYHIALAIMFLLQFEDDVVTIIEWVTVDYFLLDLDVILVQSIRYFDIAKRVM